MIIALYFIIDWILPAQWTYDDPLYGISYQITSLGIFFATVIGLVAGVLIGVITEFFTGFGKPPVKSIARQSLTGTATNIIAGLSNGMFSTAIPVIIIAISIIAAFLFWRTIWNCNSGSRYAFKYRYPISS
ncbi:MAG: sodium/proton-translocating pyrophosphatase [Ignavibacteriales bacterium]|nr:sodium/proton-translocating pyrophosphatase [Ignavibacteriales bacterium]